ncbi:MAG TPA: PDDEXK nuclease domain-containing protein [Saprospiraceae bacterium]|nr:PDDEXK nuclease domain-containing protein [Saprospiraceae bacterium]
MDFIALLEKLRQTHDLIQQRVATAISNGLVVRNWLIGHYIVEFEQNGRDYAQYGERLLYRLSEELAQGGMKGMSYTNLTLYRKFYLGYPHLSSIAGRFSTLQENLQPVAEDLSDWQLPAETLLKRLSFTHFVELLKLDNPMQRLFYEMECIKGNWSRRQLQRQIGSLLFERTGLSRNKEALLAQIKDDNSPIHIADFIREPYVFEFLGLKMEDAFLESDLEKALLEHLQSFLLELGNGFCFEARQKSFLIDNRRYKIDLLFYHRILKCHVVVDLKTRQFEPEDAGQMNFYLNFHRENLMTEDDNPPVGIILCTYKNEAVVRYATGSLDNQLFISRYLLQLPNEEILRNFLLQEKRLLGDIQ